MNVYIEIILTLLYAIFQTLFILHHILIMEKYEYCDIDLAVHEFVYKVELYIPLCQFT